MAAKLSSTKNLLPITNKRLPQILYRICSEVAFLYYFPDEAQATRVTRFLVNSWQCLLLQQSP